MDFIFTFLKKLDNSRPAQYFKWVAFIL